jgi:hypothetical protein
MVRAGGDGGRARSARSSAKIDPAAGEQMEADARSNCAASWRPGARGEPATRERGEGACGGRERHGEGDPPPRRPGREGGGAPVCGRRRPAAEEAEGGGGDVEDGERAAHQRGLKEDYSFFLFLRC